jgi:predicted Zn-dependent protease with MMP-like domain
MAPDFPPRYDWVAMNRERFQQLVAEALEEIPEPFSGHLETIAVVVEDEPSPELLREMGLHPRRDPLFGLYERTPLAERAFDDSLALPDRITIFYRPLVRTFRTPAAIRREIRKTVVHELAHFFGLEDHDIEAEGY